MHFNLRAVLVTTIFCLTATPTFAGAGPIYVNQAAPPGGDGTSWATAYRDLHDALAAAVGPQQIWIAQGNYVPRRLALGIPNPRFTFAVPGSVHLYGGFAGHETSLDHRDPAKYPTILNGDLNADDTPDYGNRSDNTPYVVQVLDTNSNAPTTLDGLTIRGAWFRTVRYSGNEPGIPLTIHNCRIEDHSSSSLELFSRELTLTDTVFTNLRDTELDYGSFQVGYKGIARIERCIFDTIRVRLAGSSAVVDCEFRDAGFMAYGQSVMLRSRWIDDPARFPGVGGFVGSAVIDTQVSGPDPDIGFTIDGGLLSGGNFHGTRDLWLSYYIGDELPIIHDCDFGGDYEYHMITSFDARARFQRCRFTDMHATKVNYGALSLNDGPYIFEECVFSRNQGELINYHGGATSPGHALIEFHRCRFIENADMHMYIYGAGMLFSDSIFVANTSSSALINNFGKGMAMHNCTFAFNDLQWHTPVAGVSFSDENTVLQAHNCLFWRNGPQSSEIDQSPLPSIDSPLVTVTNCLGTTLDTTYPNAGNISADPQFIDPLGPDKLPATGDEDLHLQSASPCIDAGLNTIDTDPFTPGVQPIGPRDADGRPRLWTTDPKSEPIVDIGALEYGAPALTQPNHAPEPMFPLDAAPHVGTRPILVWKPVLGSTSYRVEIARDATMTDTIADIHSITRPCLDAKPLNLPFDTTLWWRVIAVGDTLSLPGPVRSFSTSIAPPPRVPTPLASDLNSDCRVDYRDLQLLVTMMRFVSGPVDQYSSPYDINHDNQLNGADLSILLSQYGSTCND